jgi:cell division protein FtsL
MKASEAGNSNHMQARTVPFLTRNGTVEPVVGRAREEEHVEIIKPEMTLQTIAEARLAQLMKEKIVTGLGFGRRGNGEIVFVVIDTQAAGPNGSEMSAIRSRVRKALQDIPFEILGDYDAMSSSDNLPNHTLKPNAASLNVIAQHRPPLAAQSEGTRGTMDTSVENYTLPGGDPTSSGSLNDNMDEVSGPPTDPKTNTTRRLSKSLIVMLLLAAVSGWGAFAYSMSSAQQQERAYLAEMSRVVADRDKLNAELNQVRAEAERNRLALERAQVAPVTARAQSQERPPQTSSPQIPPRAPVRALPPR